jgi:hypothetical protein
MALVLTTQPGWAFATLRELERINYRGRVELYHHDSTILLPDAASPGDLRTPESIYGCLSFTRAGAGADATDRLRRELDQPGLRDRILSLLPQAPKATPRRYSIDCELWGRTALQRNELADLVRLTMRRVLPQWRELPAGGLRLVCKADPDAALLGLQLYSNLEAAGLRPGSLRRHLAASLLAVAGVGDGDCVFDPFMGSGTILREARAGFEDVRVTGSDVDGEAVRLAQQALGEDAALSQRRFQELDAASLPEGFRLVSNLPFGVRFQSVPTVELARFLDAIESRCDGLTLLTARRQAQDLARSRDLRVQPVLVLGQPASVVYRS